MMRYSYFWLALMVHVLLFVCFSLMLVRKPFYEEKSEQYVPAYVFHETMSAPRHSKPAPFSKNGIEKKPKSISTQTQKSLPTNPHVIELTPEKNINKPLLKILHDATAAHLVYPAIAIDFQQTGAASIAFLIQSNGVISKVHLLKSSGSQVLDEAALDAVRTMSPVKSASLYVKETQYLAVDVIFK